MMGMIACRRALWAGAAVAALTFGFAGLVQAKTTSPDTPQDSAMAHAEQDAVSAGGSSATDDIIVVARKRAESIEDVPSSVSALSAGDIERLGVRDLADLTRQVAGAMLVASGPAYLNDITLRGQGGGRLGFSESTTGIYRDGVYVAGGGFGGRGYDRMDFYDINRLEVYRGPQGAMYGRNAVGGATNLITNRPVLDTQVSGKIGYNSVDELDAEATLNLPVSSAVALRVGGYRDKQSGGFYTDAVTGRTIDKQLNWGVRGTLGAGIDTASTAYLTIEHSRSEAPGYTSLGQNKVLDPDPFVRTGLNVIDRINIDKTRALGEFTHDFGPSALTVLADFESRDGARTSADFDHYLGIRVPFAQLYDAQGETFDRYGGELRWGSTGKARLSWLAGGDFMTFTSEVYSNRTGTITGTSATANTLRKQLRLQQSRQETSSYSVYGLIGYDLTSRLNLTAEARFQIDRIHFTFQQIDLDATTNETIPLTNFDRTWRRFLPTVSLNYRASERLSFYARVATGYRAGGFNQTPAQGYFDRVPYNPEDIVQGELGTKWRAALGPVDLRGQLALYYGVTKNVQQTTPLTAVNPTFTLENVGDDHIYGAELELNASTQIAGGRFNLGFNLSGERGRWHDGATIIYQGRVLDLSGRSTPRTRDYIINLTGNYDHELGGGLSAVFTASYQTAAGGYDNASLERKSQNYSMLDLSAGIRATHWSLLGYVKNVTDDLFYTVEVSGNDFYNTPRTYGAKFTFNW